jgi:DNA modification methylase
MEQLTWKVEKRQVSDLKNWEKNPRKITAVAFGKLKDRIIKRGMHDVLKTDGHDVVLSGNQRKRALIDLGITEVFVMIPSRELTEEEKGTIALESNKNDGEWDWDMLANNFDIDNLKDIGFTNNEIGFMQEEAEEDSFDAEAEAAKNATPESKPGEVYELGRHRLMCGSSDKLEDVQKLMNGEKASLIFTDPPYMVDYTSPAGMSYESKKYGGDGGRILNDNLKPEDAIAFYTQVLKNLYAVSEDYAPLYWWYASRNQDWNRKAFEEAGWKFSQIIIWVKNSMILSRQDFHRCYEPCMFGWKEGKSHYTNKMIANLKDVEALDVEHFSDMLDVWFQKRDNTQSYIHPTQKPVRLAGRAIRKSSLRDQIVVDLFGGSGSTLIACEQMERKCYTMELDPKYCDAIRKRYKQYVERGHQQ